MLGRTCSAQRALRRSERSGADTESAYPRAIHARCVGMLADDYDTAFAEALAWDDRRPMPFERARTHLAYGRRLHRERRRADARVQLRAALDGFDRLGAGPWAAQARNELRAAGGRRRPRSACDSWALSAQESRVAAAAARGGSTREIAAELFLAPKTVECHLGQIYRKLGVRTRAPDDRRARGWSGAKHGATVEPAGLYPRSTGRWGHGRGSGSGRQSVPSGELT